MLFIIGVVALAVTIGVFALPILFIVVVVRSIVNQRGGESVATTSIQGDPDAAFAQVVQGEWPDEIARQRTDC
jgi:hypothetical protein